MITKPLMIQKIEQKDNQNFSIVWSDGIKHDFRLSFLQKNCPCANCRDENTGKILIDPKTVHEDVRAISIRNVGSYALQIKFTSGCSTGIFSFDMLRALKGEKPL